MKPLYLSEPQIKAIQAGTLAQVWVPMKVQPPSWAVAASSPYPPMSIFQWSEAEHNPPQVLRRWPVDEDGVDYALKAPHRPGDIMAVKETWCVRYGMAYSSGPVQTPLFEVAEVTYQDGSGREVCFEGCAFVQGETEAKYGDPTPEKRSPVTMPTWAVRYRLKVTSVDAVMWIPSLWAWQLGVERVVSA